MVDFKKLRKDRAHPVPTDPIEIFRRLPKSSGINDLWNSQAEALREWYSRRNDKDIVIKLNTGGKTLVGLLIAQSIMNECHGPTLYLSLTTQLVDQTVTLAKQYGIQAVTYETGENLHEDFLRASSVMVATYAALFNGQSKFGILGGILGACHGLEFCFVFGTHAYSPAAKEFHGSGPAADALAKKIQDAWLALARTGDPSCDSLGSWPKYGGKRETMMLGEQCAMEEAPYDEERRAWESVPNSVVTML